MHQVETLRGTAWPKVMSQVKARAFTCVSSSGKGFLFRFSRSISGTKSQVLQLYEEIKGVVGSRCEDLAAVPPSSWSFLSRPLFQNLGLRAPEPVL